MTRLEPQLRHPGPIRDDYYEVEDILDSHRRRGVLQYFVKWKGYPLADASWVTSTDVSAPKLQRLFHQQHPTKVGGRSETYHKNLVNSVTCLPGGTMVEGAACWARQLAHVPEPNITVGSFAELINQSENATSVSEQGCDAADVSSVPEPNNTDRSLEELICGSGGAASALECFGAASASECGHYNASV
ncbi:hypothetical protein E2320_020519 [Naja naja]|nr:hypothetical protein E2320_020519 [Naja naja]